MLEGEIELIVVVAQGITLRLCTGAHDHAFYLSSEAPRCLRILRHGVEIEIIRCFYNGLQPEIITRMAGVETVIGAGRFARRPCGGFAIALLVFENTYDREQRVGVIAAVMHEFCASCVGFKLHITAKARDQLRTIHAGGVIKIARARHYISRHCRDAVGNALCPSARVVALSNMTDLMGDNARQFGLAIQIGKETSVDVDETARKRESVDIRRV